MDKTIKDDKKLTKKEKHQSTGGLKDLHGNLSIYQDLSGLQEANQFGYYWQMKTTLQPKDTQKKSQS